MLIEGIFKYECKNRFIAIVNINGIDTECYLSSSTKISHFIDLTNRIVFLTINSKKNSRTKYTIHSTIINGVHILLNLNYTNKLFYTKILKGNTCYEPEKTINSNLKVDFLCKNTNEIIELKGVLSEVERATFPHHTSKRIIRQLKEFKKENYTVKLILILMNPNIKIITLDKENKEFYNIFKVLKNKLHIEIYSYMFENSQEYLIPEQYELNNDIIFIK